MKTLDQISYELQELSAQARMLLAKQYPVGTTIEFHIMSGQKNPSTGTVKSHTAYISLSGFVALGVSVDHSQAKPRSRYRLRTVYLNQIISGGAKT